MGSLSIWHWLVVGAVLLLVFGGRGKISDMMGDVAKGIKAFKKGMADDDTAEAPKSDAPMQDHRPSGAGRHQAARRIREQGLARAAVVARIAAANASLISQARAAAAAERDAVAESFPCSTSAGPNFCSSASSR